MNGHGVQFLGRVSIFADLTQGDLKSLLTGASEREFAKNEVMVHRDGPGRALFVILEGEAKAVLTGESEREIILSFFRAGDFFGEMALIDEQARSAHVVATRRIRALVLARDSFMAVLHARPAMALRVMSELAARLRRSDEIIENLALLGAYGRVARFLIKSAEGVPPVDGWHIMRQFPSQREVAGLTGTTRETVSRLFREYRRRGLLKTTRKGVLYISAALAAETGAGDR
jgi:CRP-like cAMP-binding protein